MAFYKLWKNWTLRCVRNECFVISNAFTVQKCQQHLKHRNFNNNYCASLIGFSWLHYCIHLFDYWEKHYHTNWDSNHKYIIIVGKLICYWMVCTSRQWCACCLLTRQHHIQGYLQWIDLGLQQFVENDVVPVDIRAAGVIMKVLGVHWLVAFI